MTKKTRNKLAAILMALAILMGTFPAAALAANEEPNENPTGTEEPAPNNETPDNGNETPDETEEEPTWETLPLGPEYNYHFDDTDGSIFEETVGVNVTGISANNSENSSHGEGAYLGIFAVTDENGNTVYAYCADRINGAKPDAGYKEVEIEDLSRVDDWTGKDVQYIDESATDAIRSILSEGYRVDDDGKNLAKLQEAVPGVTAAEAMVATQWAIWLQTNNDEDFLKTLDSGKLVGEDVDKVDEARIKELCNYLLDNAKANPISKDTIINEVEETFGDLTEANKTAETVAEGVAEKLDKDQLLAMETGDKALQTNDNGDSYLIEKNEDGTYTVTVVFDFAAYGDLSDLMLEVTNNGETVVETGLTESATTENGSWTYGDSKGTLMAKLAQAVNNLMMNITGKQKTGEEFVGYEGRFHEGMKNGEGKVENEWIGNSQNLVGIKDIFEQVAQSMSFTIDLSDDGEITVTPDVEQNDPPAPPAPPVTDDGDDDDTTLPEPPVPMAEPAEETTEIAEEDVPLSEIADEEVPLEELPDEEVPLADLPQTGALAVRTGLGGMLLAASAAMAAMSAALWLTGRKKENA